MKVGIIQYPGSNCDLDTYRFFDNPIFISYKETELPNIDILVIPGGFAFGDRYYEEATGEYTILPGKMSASSPVSKVIFKAAENKIPIIGICNGFQILIQLGLLPGSLIKNINKNQIFTSKKVKCKLNLILSDSTYKDDIELDIANGYGNYQVEDNILKGLNDNNQIFLKYDIFDNGSREKIAGITNKDKTIFGMMPHPERNKDNIFKHLFYKIYNNAYDISFHTKITELMYSEHISYKSTKHLLSKLPTTAPHVIQGPGENAGIIDIDDDYCLALRIESHNHPVFIDPFEGAATGVGGILRDIFTMGARPIAILDFLRFGTDDNSDRLVGEAIKGIANYGNTFGVANVGGDYYRHESYNKNPLVNIAAFGIVKKNKIVYGNALSKNSLLIYVGSKTGKEGIGGAAMASKQFTGDTSKLKDNVQKGDPYLEKLLCEACQEITEKKLAEGMQDMGAGGLLCASLEVIKRGREYTGKNLGCSMLLDNIPIKHDMENCDKLISESQERMLIVAQRDKVDEIYKIFSKWDLEYALVGEVNNTGLYTVLSNETLLYSEKLDYFNVPDVYWEGQDYTGTQNTVNANKIKNGELWEQYDSTIGCRTIKGSNEPGDYAILDIYEVGKKLVLTWGENLSNCQSYMENSLDCKPLAIINCLNFGHPKDSMRDFKDTINKMKQSVPIVGGNVSLYNCTEGVSIRPTPIFVVVGIM